jgi:predicted ATPase
LLGQSHWAMGSFVSARVYLERCLSHDVPDERDISDLLFHHDRRAASLSFLSLVLLSLGYPDRAEAASSAALERAGILGHALTTGLVLFIRASFAAELRGAPPLAVEASETAVRFSAEHSLPQFAAWGRISQGVAQIQRNYLERGVALIRERLAAAKALKADLLLPMHLAYLGYACQRCGELQEASSLFGEAIRLSENSRVRFFEAEACRIQGEFLLELGQSTAGETLLLRAIEVARSQEARLWELRASTSVARLLRKKNRREARDVLAPVYGWFTEGFDTSDLKEAKALLDELA